LINTSFLRFEAVTLNSAETVCKEIVVQLAAKTFKKFLQLKIKRVERGRVGNYK